MVEDMTPEALKRRLDDGEPVQVIDIRLPAAFEQGHIPGAENVPFHEFARSVADRDWSDDIVVACPMGESSLQAARLLEAYEGVSADATVSNLVGGYEAWEYELEAGAPAARESD